MISATVVGKEQVMLRLGQIPDRVRAQLLTATNKLAIDLTTYIQRNKLSGQVLKNRTGKLRRSIHPTVTESGTTITGQVGTNTEYAAAHEYGCHDLVTVREHLRRLGSFNAKGQELGRTKAGKLRSGKNVYHTYATVKAHQMQMNLPERSFLRSALMDMESQIREGLQAAVAKGLK